jgi:anti-sigma B factor antagonist
LKEYKVLKSRKVGDVLIFDIAGSLSLGEEAVNLRDALRKAVADGERKVVLNMADTTYVDSCGIGEMVSGFQTLGNHGAQLKLLALSNKVKDFLKVTKLYTVFDVFEDEAAAVRSFN